MAMALVPIFFIVIPGSFVVSIGCLIIMGWQGVSMLKKPAYYICKDCLHCFDCYGAAIIDN